MFRSFVINSRPVNLTIMASVCCIWRNLCPLLYFGAFQCFYDGIFPGATILVSAFSNYSGTTRNPYFLISSSTRAIPRPLHCLVYHFQLHLYMLVLAVFGFYILVFILAIFRHWILLILTTLGHISFLLTFVVLCRPWIYLEARPSRPAPKYFPNVPIFFPLPFSRSNQAQKFLETKKKRETNKIKLT